MKAKILLFCTVFCVVTFLMSSCVKEEFDMDTVSTTNWNPNGAGPLINSSLTMWDILDDYDSTDLLVVDSNQFVYLVYEDTVYSQSAEELITLNNQALNYSDNLTIPGGNLATDYTASYDVDFDFALAGGMELDSLMLKQGLLNLSLNSDLNYPATIIMSLPGSTQNGTTYRDTLNYSGTSGNISSGLAGTKLVFDNTIVDNRLAVHFDVIVHGNGATNNSPYFLNFNMSFNTLNFRYLYGYLGQFDLSLNNDTIGIRVYNNSLTGTVNWEDPRLYVNVYNGWGLPIRATTDYLAAIRTNTPPATVVISGPGIPNPWDINYPSSMGQIASSSFILNKSNSNIDAGLNITPQKILALVSGSTNPNGNVTKNFVEDVSRMAVEAKLELPFYGTANGFIIQDTFNTDLGEDLSHIDWVLFKLYTNNMFPIDGTVQLYFCDSLYNRLDSLLNPVDQSLVAATPGPAPDYIVTSPVAKMVSQTISGARVLNLENTKHIIVRARLDTYNSAGSLVKIYSYYKLDIRLSAQVQLKFNSNDL